MNELQKRRLNFLEDTVEYYKTNPRGIGDDGNRCCYSSGCAIGRCLPMDLCSALDLGMKSSVSDTVVFDRLPSWLRELGREFLFSIQCLHDSDGNWYKTDLGNELSKKGIVRVNNIKQCYGLVSDTPKEMSQDTTDQLLKIQVKQDQLIQAQQKQIDELTHREVVLASVVAFLGTPGKLVAQDHRYAEAMKLQQEDIDILKAELAKLKAIS